MKATEMRAQQRGGGHKVRSALCSAGMLQSQAERKGGEGGRHEKGMGLTDSD